jgi:flagellar hook-associated protein 1 FlgK
MALTGALNSAANGLSTTQSLSRIAADNVANAMTPGYTRRTAKLVSLGGGQGGAVISAINREVDASLVRMSRLESSKMARQQAIHEGLRGYTVYLGQPGDGTSPADKFASFQTNLTTLVNMPSSTGAQTGTVLAAEELASSIRGASNTLARTSAEVDMEIRYEVADLNQALYDLAAMNGQRQRFNTGSMEAAEFDDKISSLLDGLSGMLDIRSTQTVDGWISVYTTGGAALLEGDKVHDVTYTSGTGTLKAGAQDITSNRAGVRGVEQGSLAGLLELNQVIIPRFQLQLDEYARGMIQGFERADASLAPGQAGLFTDNGLAYNAANTKGLSSRIRVNSLVSSTGSSEVWRLRDGLGVTAEGAPSEASQVQAFVDVLNTSLNANQGTGIPVNVTIADFAAEFVTSQATEQARAERNYNAASSAAEIVKAARQNAEGVNIDDEMQRLMLIEQSYAANSKVLQAVTSMLDTLLAAV